MPDTTFDEHAVVRLVTAYHDSWQAHFPNLFKRSHWHTAAHLCTKGRRNGAHFVELHGVGGKVFWLDDATMKARINELVEYQLCILDPPDAPLSRGTKVIPTAALLERFDRHLLDFSRQILLTAHEMATARGIGGEHPPPITDLNDNQRQIVLQFLEYYREQWKEAIDQILEARDLSPARIIKAKRDLMATPHSTLLHAAVSFFYEKSLGITQDHVIFVNDMVPVLWSRTRQAAQATHTHTADLVYYGFLNKGKIKSKHSCVILSEAAVPLLTGALARTALDLPGVARKLIATLPPATSGLRLGEQTSKIVLLAPPNASTMPEAVPTKRARHVSRDMS